MSGTAQVAFNPLTWYFSSSGQFAPDDAPPLAHIYREIREAGFHAVHTEMPQDMSVDDYRRLLDDSGLAPAPGYFHTAFSDPARIPGAVEEAKRTAGHHAQLGLSRIFIADGFSDGPRRERPAQGADADAARLDRIATAIGTVAEAMVAEGVTPCLHQHVGTWIETESETEAVLAAVDRELLLLGPDTGHLAWAGVDPARFIEKHLDRIGAVHLKDLHGAIRTEAFTESLDYFSAGARHLWTEPGRGDIDFDDVLDVLSRFDGWYVIEVDVADQPTPRDTATVSARWVSERLTGGHNDRVAS
ncbi:sugar phosphate isomerase/epimerase [Streptomyces phaeochromogenes]|uniref:Sugar phosphate isomerase/epimerase n=1 Tax=Streptomyces phaeochromogenes TaxID=1923 RepID=A0ABZ1HP01_STRPH|nr:sugar phosphate isomerase/epimerase [Streptomyces phaeochromogenes]WSD19749.1 sugar phosphate isomerase/epimerase [Streptomyces phaeochromogenes]